MKIIADLHGTQRRATLRNHRATVDRRIAEEQARKETGSPLPAFLVLAIVCVGVAIGLWIR